MRYNTLLFAGFVGLVAAQRHAVRNIKAEQKMMVPRTENDLDVDELVIIKEKEVPASECKYKSGDGSIVITLYNGKLLDGKIIDNSWDVNDPHQFQIGPPLVIEGLQLAVKDMCVGEVRRVTIPSRLGHGSKPHGGGLIPPNSAIEYHVTLIGMKPPMYPNPEYFEWEKSQKQAAASATESVESASGSTEATETPAAEESQATEPEQVHVKDEL
ncbi:Peptidyl-prolyl cis-trans isomerase fpr2 [Orbilia ellipsospora]|uniref:peptidylprolyl isomerase n=1 Tax=Orbilia ellipsospora TaxID=2528407 RepID=A0AAV9WZR9_9PEZI